MEKKDVENIACLCRLHLSEQEKDVLTGQLVKILEYIDQLKDVDISCVEPMGQPLGHVMDKLRMAGDIECRFDRVGNLTKIAPDFEGGFYRVRRIIE